MIQRPNVIIIGAGKAGSTSLHNYLDAHPLAFGSKEKELMYFSTRGERGIDWYRSQFPEDPQTKVYFESTPQYSFRDEFPAVAGRIRDFNPGMKILYIVREPISRIVSHFKHWNTAYPDRFTNLEESLKSPAHRKYFIDRTKYFYQLEAYRAVFPDEQIRVVFLEDLKADLAGTMNRVFRFLGIDECGDSIPQKIHNQSSRFTPNRAAQSEDISVARIAEIRQTLSSDVHQLMSYVGKPADFWGSDYADGGFG